MSLNGNSFLNKNFISSLDLLIHPLEQLNPTNNFLIYFYSFNSDFP